ncbi:MAG: hypothetical protein ACLGH4_02630 [Actinomycetes bacterium]
MNVRTRAIGRGRVLLSLATAALALSGCGQTTLTANTPEVRTGELVDAGGQPCPKRMPIGEDPSGHGFGVEEVADQPPTLLEVQEAWVCQYNPVDVGTTSSGGAVFGWRREGQPQPVAADDLADLQDALDDLAPADRGGGCNDDLGPRWMVAYSHDGDLTAVVVDDYGCRDVRLTDDPHTTPPGADNQVGTVGGVLDGGAAILDALGVGRSD